MRKNKKKKGFTLIEVVAGLAVFAVVSTVIMSMILNVNKYNAENKNQFDASAMSRAFNEGIKSIRPVDNDRDGANGNEVGYPSRWDKNNLGTKTEYYTIMCNDINGLNIAIKESLLINTHPNDTSTNPATAYHLTEQGNVGKTEEELVEFAKNWGVKYKYIIEIAVQNKDTEKVYVFDTQTIDIDAGITTAVDRKFAISSIA